ncbi:MAG TPA: hypothetical protein HA224_04705 [Nanoarchaeota archaeon]|nr:hypothetical protein [Nanoarchaeota archaeon]
MLYLAKGGDIRNLCGLLSQIRITYIGHGDGFVAHEVHNPKPDTVKQLLSKCYSRFFKILGYGANTDDFFAIEPDNTGLRIYSAREDLGAVIMRAVSQSV